MTGAEITAAASDVSVVTIVCLIMMVGCAFGMALGFPWHWLVAAVVLFMLLSGYPGGAIVAIAASFTLHTYAPKILRWFESLDIGRGAPDHARGWSNTAGSSQRRHKPRTSGKPKDDFNSDDFFGKASRDIPRPPPVQTGPDPKTTLGLSAGFTMKDLDAARRTLAKKFHPDLHRRASKKKQEHVAEKMRMINAAYETLKSQAL